MRLLTAFLLTALLAACGGDEPEPAQQQAPEQQQPEQPATPAQQPQPAPQQPEPEPEPPAQPAMDQDLYTVQVAAFTDPETAREWAARLRAQQVPVWTSVAQVGGRTFHRLRIGALPSLDETYRLGEMVRERYDWPYWVAPLTAADRLPVNTVQNTRQMLRGG